MSPSPSEAPVDPCMVGGGEAGALMRSIDWSKSPLGPVATWPMTLRTTVGIMLASSFGMRVLWGKDFIFLHNDAYRPVLGTSKYPKAMGSRTSESFAELWHVVGPMFQRVMEGDTITLDDRILPLDRHGYLEECFFTLSYSPLSDDQGGIGGVLGVVYETTQRVLAERRLRALRKLAGAVSTAREVVSVCRATIRTLAEAKEDVPFALLYLRSASGELELVERTGLDDHPAARPETSRTSTDNASNGWPWVPPTPLASAWTVYDVRVRFGDIREAPWSEPITQARVLALQGPGESAPYGYLVAGVSPRRALDHEYETFFELAGQHIAAGLANASAIADAEAASRSKDEFFAIVSHELRNPLNAMLGWTRLLRGGSLTEERKARALETIERNATNQAQLIEDLLDISRVISGKLPLDVQTVTFARVIEAAVDSARPAIDAKGLRLSLVLDTDGVLSGDPSRLQQIVWNLLTNATKFTPRGGTIRVELRRNDSHLELAVVDNGQGIAPTFIDHVFDRFKQADPSSTRQHGGLGLGLAIAKNLVEMHGGTIEAHSAGLGHGSSFVVRVPVAAMRRTSSPQVPPRPIDTVLTLEKPAELAGLRVLVVDDEPDARELVTEVLAACGALVTSAASPAIAMAVLRAEAPDVLLSDIGMPGEDGYSLIARIRALPREEGGTMPAACLTGYTTVDDRRKALGAGFNMHLSKPIEPSELIAVVASLGRMAIALRRDD